jgi:prepilin-type N-terminal cleavage/methylation domain-containing protein
MDGLNEDGITLIELLIVIAIFTILVPLAATRVLALSQHYALLSDVRDLKNSLAFCRLEAIKRNTSITVVFNTPDHSYVAFVDDDSSCEQNPDTEGMLAQNRFSRATFDLSKSDGDGLTFVENDNGYPAIRWNEKGFPCRNDTGFGAGTAYLTDGISHYCVVVTKTGVIRITSY